MFGLSIVKRVTLQKIVAHDFRYVPRTVQSVLNERGRKGNLPLEKMFYRPRIHIQVPV